MLILSVFVPQTSSSSSYVYVYKLVYACASQRIYAVVSLPVRIQVNTRDDDLIL